MTRIVFFTLAIFMCTGAQAAVPEFNTDHFCADFAEKRGDSMGGIAKSICLLSEQSTKAVVDKAWDHVPADGKTTCLKASGESYVSLAQCLQALPAQ
jgi:hypothetical protein